jgi:hypothetical protein
MKGGAIPDSLVAAFGLCWAQAHVAGRPGAQFGETAVPAFRAIRLKQTLFMRKSAEGDRLQKRLAAMGWQSLRIYAMLPRLPTWVWRKKFYRGRKLAGAIPHVRPGPQDPDLQSVTQAKRTRIDVRDF